MPAAESHPAPSYIVRIYRRDAHAAEITGIVEIPEQATRLAFRSFAELKTILNGGDTTVSPVGRSRPGGNP